MKRLYLFALLVLFTAVFFSCEEEDGGNDTPDISGFWLGNYDGTNAHAALYRSDGTVRVYDITVSDTTVSDKYEGVYTVGSDSVRTTYTFGSNFIGTATKLSNNNIVMTGTWGFNSTGGGGTVSMTKQ